MTTKLIATLVVVGCVVFALLVLWFTPSSRDRFLDSGARWIDESGTAMRTMSAREIEDSRDVLVRLIRHTTDSRRREVADIPLAVYAEDLERFRDAVVAQDDERRTRLERNVEILAREMSMRATKRIDANIDALTSKQRDESEVFAATLRRSSLVLLAATLGLLLLVLGLLLYRSVVWPIRRLQKVTRAVAGGAHDGRRLIAETLSPKHWSTDEVGQLKRDFERMLEELEAARRTQEEKLASLETLAGGVAHEFNNLIGGIRGTASEALAGDADEDFRRESLAVIRRAADRGAEITSQLRRYSRASRAVRHSIDLAGVLSDALALLRPDAQHRGIEFVVRSPSSLIALVDGDGLHQVFLNVVRNAIQAMPRGGRIEIDLGRGEGGGDAVEFCVTDHGEGIPRDVIGRIFDPFFTTKQDAVDGFQRGSGLGLSVSHGVVTAHGGTMDVDSEPGRGTTFRIRIPLDDEATRVET
ncbi:MAG: HAMP domain-containing histidine kinase [Planctomycetes bacterium]|nr:HAMP domain-containing histidine kinase [Planctomycetota bacterium]